MGGDATLLARPSFRHAKSPARHRNTPLKLSPIHRSGWARAYIRARREPMQINDCDSSARSVPGPDVLLGFPSAFPDRV